MRTAAPPPTRRSCSRPACSSIPSNPSASRRSSPQPSSTRRWSRGEALLTRMFSDFRLFRLIMDEVEKTLAYVDLDLARGYAELVADPWLRQEIFSLVTDEYHRTVAVVRRLTGCTALAERFPQFRQRLANRLPTLNQVNRQQIELLRRHRATAAEQPPEDELAALLLSINCIAAGLGTTG